jgi:hypothetical protein
MADTKISALPAGSPAALTDQIPIARSGSNYYITPAQILAATSSPLQVGASFVGIGTASPATFLDVSFSGGMARFGSTSNNNMVQVSSAQSLGMWAGGNSQLYSSAGLIFLVGATTGTGTPTGGTQALSIASNGAVTIAGAPGAALTVNAASATTGLSVVGASNSYAQLISAPNTAGTSFGLKITAGTTTGDYSFVSQNALGANLFTVNGFGGATITTTGANISLNVTNAITSNGSAVVINTAGAGNTGVVGLQVSDGVTTSVYGYTVGTSHIIGTTTSHNLALMTFNSVRLTINNAGNFTITAPSSGIALTANGIGSSSTAFLAGGSTASANLTLAANLGGGTFYWLSAKNSGVFHIGGNGATEPAAGAIQITNTGAVTVNTPSAGIALSVTGFSGAAAVQANVTNTGTQYAFAGTNGTDSCQMFFDSGGNVYFGTTTNSQLIIRSNNVNRMSFPVTGGYRPTALTYATLPTPAAGNAGLRAVISDAAVVYGTASVGTTITSGGGANYVPVFSTGSAWIIG